MHRLRFAILGAVAALAMGTASAVAMQQSAGGGTDPDQHGDLVASAARNCPQGPGGVHGHCVSAVASSNSEGDENANDESSKAAACKAADKTEDASETKPAKGDKAAKAADKTEDKSEHTAFAACVSGGASGSEDESDNDASETPDTDK